ncbi:MAG: hypothetical protein J0I93_14520 [Legionella sp.]|nr:hypothetical protein [Legionella sp.]
MQSQIEKFKKALREEALKERQQWEQALTEIDHSFNPRDIKPKDTCLIIEKINAAGLSALANALKTNSTLLELKIAEFHLMSPEAKKTIRDALKENYTITAFNHSLNTSWDALRANIDRILKNESFVKVERDEQIDAYLLRNQQLTNCLKPLIDALAAGEWLTDGAVIDPCLKTLEALLPKLHQLTSQSYPQQAYYLLTYFKGRAQAIDESPLKKFCSLLNLAPFLHPPFQAGIRQLMLQLLFSGALSFVFETQNLISEEQLLILSLLEDSLDKLEHKPFAEIALFKILHPEQKFTLGAREAFAMQTVLLPEKEIRELLSDIRLRDTVAFATRQKIWNLLEAPRGWAGLLETACTVPEFIKAIKAKYPQVQSVTAIAHCFWAHKNQRPLTLPLTHAPQPQLEVLPDFNTTPKLEDLTSELKQSLAAALSDRSKGMEEAEAVEVNPPQPYLFKPSSTQAYTLFASKSNAEPLTDHELVDNRFSTSLGVVHAYSYNLLTRKCMTFRPAQTGGELNVRLNCPLSWIMNSKLQDINQELLKYGVRLRKAANPKLFVKEELELVDCATQLRAQGLPIDKLYLETEEEYTKRLSSLGALIGQKMQAATLKQEVVFFALQELHHDDSSVDTLMDAIHLHFNSGTAGIHYQKIAGSSCFPAIVYNKNLLEPVSDLRVNEFIAEFTGLIRGTGGQGSVRQLSVCAFKKKNQDEVFLAASYHADYATINQNKNEHLMLDIAQLAQKYCVIMGGDFNKKIENPSAFELLEGGLSNENLQVRMKSTPPGLQLNDTIDAVFVPYSLDNDNLYENALEKDLYTF